MKKQIIIATLSFLLGFGGGVFATSLVEKNDEQVEITTEVATDTDVTEIATDMDAIELDVPTETDVLPEPPDYMIENIERYKTEAAEKEAERLAKQEEEKIQITEIETVLVGNYDTTPIETTEAVYTQSSDDGVLTAHKGVNYGPSGKETYYNLPMQGVVNIAQSQGIQGEYWVREDGCKMYGDYIICAANLDVHPRGSLVESSLGTCIVLDTGGFAAGNPTQIDIATDW